VRYIFVLFFMFFFCSPGYPSIESYFFWGGSDTARCYAFASGTATGGPNITIAIYGEGIPSAGPRRTLTSTVTIHTEKDYEPEYHAPMWNGIVETSAGNPQSVETPMERMQFTCDEYNPEPLPHPHECPVVDPFNSSDDRSKAIICDEHSPIVIDTRDNGFHFGAPGRGVFFDLYATGNPIFIQWVKPHGDDAFLVRDINHNGLVDDGSELFGNGTVMILEEKFAPNGFVGLSQFDSYQLGGNNDGDITFEDQVWGELYLWLDLNADAVSTSNEMTPIGDTIFTRFQTIPTESNIVDSAGNGLRFWAWSFNESVSNDKYRMVDVFFLEVE